MPFWNRNEPEPSPERSEPAQGRRSVYEELAARRRLEKPDHDDGWLTLGEIDPHTGRWTPAANDWAAVQRAGGWVPIDRFTPRS